MMTDKQRILSMAKGEIPDVIPFVPRLDIWYNANQYNDTLPSQYRHESMDAIARSEGWALYKILPEDYDRNRESSYAIHRALGLYTFKEAPYRVKFSSNINIQHTLDGSTLEVVYDTPVGNVRTKTRFIEEMFKAGTTESWIEEPAIKSSDDYRAVAYIFEHLELVPTFEDHCRWRETIGDDGLAVTFATAACSPIHHIQKVLIDPTAFFYHYNDHNSDFRILASCIENFYEQALDICVNAPGEAVHWGENIDGTLTPPPLLKKEFLPWIKKATDRLHQADKVVFSHTDGENYQLMDIIKFSGIDVAESICPYPMTRVTIDEFYRHWNDQLTIMGGIPSDLLIPAITSEKDFEGYLDYLFKAVAPGNRIIFGITDNIPPAADFNRLIRVGERIRNECGLPLAGGEFNPIRVDSKEVLDEAETEQIVPHEMQSIRQAMFDGNEKAVCECTRQLLDNGINAEEILQQGLISAMQVIGVKFKDDLVFMPEVLLSARAMNAGLELLEPHMLGDKQNTPVKIIIGTVFGDLHDIGKNMVSIMLRGVGYDVIDLGINITAEDFLKSIVEYQPQILALSALLSTTMPEMSKVIKTLEEAGLRDKVLVIVGGAPVTANFADKIGADGYAESAGEVSALIEKLIQYPQREFQEVL